MAKQRSTPLNGSDIPCTEMYLGSDLQIAAAQTAVQENPANEAALYSLAAVGITATPQRIAVLTTKYWRTNGVRLTVGFMESTPADLRSKLLQFFNNWGKFANVAFTWSQTDPQVRVTRAQQGYWSYLGTDILSIPRNQPTMCLQGFTMNTRESEWFRVVQHEVGHTLGCPHEHMRKDIIALLDVEKTVAYFQRTQGWSRQEVMQQVLTPLDERSVMGTPTADQLSIMTYQLPASITKAGVAIPGGNDFAPQDRDFFSKLYPLAVVPPVEPPTKPPEPPTTAKGDIKFFVDLASKLVSVSCPAGYTVQKMAQESNSGAPDMTSKKETPANVQMMDWAIELEVAAEKANALAQAAPEGAQSGIIIDVVTKVNELVTALKTGNWLAALRAAHDLLGILLQQAGDTGTIQFAPGSPAAAIDWKKVGGVLVKLLPFLLELFAKGA